MPWPWYGPISNNSKKPTITSGWSLNLRSGNRVRFHPRPNKLARKYDGPRLPSHSYLAALRCVAVRATEMCKSCCICLHALDQHLQVRFRRSAHDIQRLDQICGYRPNSTCRRSICSDSHRPGSILVRFALLNIDAVVLGHRTTCIPNSGTKIFRDLV